MLSKENLEIEWLLLLDFPSVCVGYFEVIVFWFHSCNWNFSLCHIYGERETKWLSKSPWDYNIEWGEAGPTLIDCALWCLDQMWGSCWSRRYLWHEKSRLNRNTDYSQHGHPLELISSRYIWFKANFINIVSRKITLEIATNDMVKHFGRFFASYEKCPPWTCTNKQTAPIFPNLGKPPSSHMVGWKYLSSLAYNHCDWADQSGGVHRN